MSVALQPVPSGGFGPGFGPGISPAIGPAIGPGDLGTPRGRHLVALDLDGTTVRHDGTLSSDVRDAVRYASALGHDIVIATGRALLGALPVIAQLGLSHGYAVCSNGAVTVALDPGAPGGYRVLRTVTFDPGPALAVLRNAWPDAQVAVEIVGHGFKVSSPFHDQDAVLPGLVEVVDWEELSSCPATRVTFRSQSGTAEDFIELAARIGLHGVNYAVGFTAWLDIAADGVSKAAGLEHVRRRLRVAQARTVAVGDQRNDVEMLAWAACGVAMGNAPVEVQAVANLVTGHVDDNGLIDVLAALPPATR